MLARAALRAATRRAAAAPVPTAAALRWARLYADDRRPPRVPPKPLPFQDGRVKKDAQQKDQTWKPKDGITFGAGSAATAGGSAPPQGQRPQRPGPTSMGGKAADFDFTAQPGRNPPPQSHGAGPGVSARNDARQQDAIREDPLQQVTPQQDALRQGTLRQEAPRQDPPQGGEYNKVYPSFDSPQSSEANSTPSSEADPTPSSTSKSMPEEPSEPLPDLRQGLPSTFAAEFLGEKAEKPSAEPETKSQASQAHETHDLNITDAPEDPKAYEGGKEPPGDLPRSAYQTSTDRRRERVANYMYLTFAGLFAAAGVYFGRNWENDHDEKAHPDAPSGWGLMLWWARVKARVGDQMGYYTEPTFEKLLPDPDKVPGGPLPPYTLVISLEDLMIHTDWTREHGWRTAKRPGIDYFLRYLSQYYELVIFTDMPMAAADPIIRKLDPFRIVQWPLFREATRYEKGHYVKDLSYLNRDLSKVILIDTKAHHAKNQPDNAIIIPPWKGQRNDRELVSYIPFLEYVATMGITDVRQVIKSFQPHHIPTEFAIRESKAREAFHKALAEEKAKRPKHSLGGALSGALGIKPTPAVGSMTLDGEHTAAQGFDQGKMLSDQIREQGQKRYEMMEKEIRENGAKWLKEMEAEEKRAQEDMMKGMKGSFLGMLGGPPKEGGQ